jgi:hypothetical protein
MYRDTKRPLRVLLLLGAFAATPMANAALYFESTSNMEVDGAGAPTVARVRGWVEGAQARIEFVSGQAMPFAASGGYMLTNDGGETVYIVNPAERTYSELDLEQLLGMANAMMQAAGGLMRMEFVDVVNEKLGEAPGGDILGYSTTHYRYRTGYTMSMAVMGFKRSTRTDTEQEFWCTDEIAAEGFKVWLSPDRYRTGNAQLDEGMRLQFQQLDCLPLRSRVASVMKPERGDETRSMTTTEVTALREEDAPAGSFELPSDFTATELLPQMSEMPAMPDTPPAAGGGDSAPAEEGRRMPRLRDLIPGR